MPLYSLYFKVKRLRRRASNSLGNLTLNISRQKFTTLMSAVLNSLNKNRLNEKSNEFSCDLDNIKHSSPYNKTGRHLEKK